MCVERPVAGLPRLLFWASDIFTPIQQIDGVRGQTDDDIGTIVDNLSFAGKAINAVLSQIYLNLRTTRTTHHTTTERDELSHMTTFINLRLPFINIRYPLINVKLIGVRISQARMRVLS